MFICASVLDFSALKTESNLKASLQELTARNVVSHFVG